MDPNVIWLESIRTGLADSALIERLEGELIRTFSKATEITVRDRFQGYTKDPSTKVVFGVEVKYKDRHENHVVKIGTRADVGSDYEGWCKCTARRSCASRIFVSLRRRKLAGRRASVVYEDAYTMFRLDSPEKSPQLLADVVKDAITEGKIDPQSVERVIRQVYGDLHYWFYRGARENTEGAVTYYKDRIRRAFPIWEGETRPNEWEVKKGRKNLRTDLIWLLGSTDDPSKAPGYLDPVDYVAWALEHGRVPRTLVGSSHGDLQAYNILVGVKRNEAEFPVLLDYGDMGDANVLIWDFVKLETELKVRLLGPLYDDPQVCNALVDGNKLRARHERQVRKFGLIGEEKQRVLWIPEWRFACEFERRLHDGWEEICRALAADGRLPSWRGTGNDKLDRALQILLRIRTEAVLLLTKEGKEHGCNCVRNEYLFALAACGVSTAKFSYTQLQTGFALISAGMAVGRLPMAWEAVSEHMRAAPAVPGESAHPYPSHHAPVAQAHALWERRKPRDLHKAFEILGHAAERYDYAALLVQELALALLYLGRRDEARARLKPFEDLACVFGDHEILCRIAAIYKKAGDAALAANPAMQFAEFSRESPGWADYEDALESYRKAFVLRRHYYPGINLAALACLLKDEGKCRKAAEAVLRPCRISRGDEFWVYGSKGDASLLLKKTAQAARLYRLALKQLRPEQVRQVQISYDQICRLSWALGRKAVRPVIAAFRDSPFWPKLKKHALGKAGLSHSEAGRRASRGRGRRR